MNAPTGSGKTLAYLAPIVADLQAQAPHVSRAEGTYALVLVPTRELCLQVSDILTLLVRRYIWLVSSPRPNLIGCIFSDSLHDAETQLSQWMTMVVPQTRTGGFMYSCPMPGAQQGHGGVQLQVLAMCLASMHAFAEA